MQYINSPQYTGIPMDFMAQQQSYTNPPFYGQQIQQPVQQQQQRPRIDPRLLETPTITLKTDDGSTKKSGMFTISDSNKTNVIHVDEPVSDMEKVAKENKRGRKKKSDSDVSGTSIVKANGSTSPAQVEESTAYTYSETTGLLRETLGQIDALNGELAVEFQNVKNNRTMKNKYNVMIGISENMGSLIGNRIQAIKEINNSITKSNDLDYKKYKDIKAAEATMSDDKYIADVYQALITNQSNMPAQHTMPSMDSAIYGTPGIVRADISPAALTGTTPVDVGYLNYVANMTPEQNLMMYENDPNVKQVVVYDAASGAKIFKMMNLATGQVIENVPTYDASIMEDTTLDLKTKTAKNINLNESFPIVVINDDITSQY